MNTTTSQPANDHNTWMAFDFGHQRTGVAIGNSISCSVQALTTIVADKTQRLDHIAQLIDQWQPQALVVGMPFHPDGSEHDMTRSAQKFIRQLRHRFALDVFSTDERYSSVEAQELGYDDLDAGAAAVILQRFLDTLSSANTHNKNNE